MVSFHRDIVLDEAPASPLKYLFTLNAVTPPATAEITAAPKITNAVFFIITQVKNVYNSN